MLPSAKARDCRAQGGPHGGGACGPACSSKWQCFDVRGHKPDSNACQLDSHAAAGYRERRLSPGDAFRLEIAAKLAISRREHEDYCHRVHKLLEEQDIKIEKKFNNFINMNQNIYLF